VVGIGGAYMCIYGMEGPGGYQLFGRTIQVWNTHRQTDAFIEGKPWLLRFFDQIRFYPVSAEELVEWRRDFPTGRRSIRIEQSEFRLADYRAFWPTMPPDRRVRSPPPGRLRRGTRRLAAQGRIRPRDRPGRCRCASASAMDVPEGADLVEAPFGGSVWKLLVAEGDEVKAGDTIAVLEAMKMECPVESPGSGVCRALHAGKAGPPARRADARPAAHA
jgi:urea carboxylase